MAGCRTGAAVAAAVAVLVLVLAVGAGGAGASTSYPDPAGDVTGIPDITGVTVSDVGGRISFEIDGAGWNDFFTAANPRSEYHVLDVNVDADRNSATGDPDLNDRPPAGHAGFDYALELAKGPNDPTLGADLSVLQWVGTSWQSEWTKTMPTDTVGSNSVTFEVGDADLGGTTGFTFAVCDYKLDGSGNTVLATDRAPDTGVWDYTLTSTSVTTTPVTTTPAASVRPVIGAPTTRPGKAVAGRRFTVSFPVTRSDTGAPLTSGKMVCHPSVKGKVIPHAESFTGGTAKLAFTIPKTAKGKQLKVKVTIKLGSQSATKIATFKVG
jgi:hypothetical protein